MQQQLDEAVLQLWSPSRPLDELRSQVGHRVPMNLFFAILARTGKLKTPIFKRLVKHPAMELIKENRAQYMRDLKDYQEAAK